MSRRFHRLDQFLDTFYSTFYRENESSVPFMSALYCKYKEQQRKSTVIKRSKMPFLAVLVSMTGFWDMKDVLNSRKDRSKNKLVSANAVTREHENCPLRVMAS